MTLPVEILRFLECLDLIDLCLDHEPTDLALVRQGVERARIFARSTSLEIRGVEAEALEAALQEPALLIMRALPDDLRPQFTVIYLAAQHRRAELIKRDWEEPR